MADLGHLYNSRCLEVAHRLLRPLPYAHRDGGFIPGGEQLISPCSSDICSTKFNLCFLFTCLGLCLDL